MDISTLIIKKILDTKPLLFCREYESSSANSGLYMKYSVCRDVKYFKTVSELVHPETGRKPLICLFHIQKCFWYDIICPNALKYCRYL